MRTKRKMSVTIDADVFETIDRLAKHEKIAKSRLAEEAFKDWIRKYIEMEMSKGYEEMSREDRDFSELTFKAQREIL